MSRVAVSLIAVGQVAEACGCRAVGLPCLSRPIANGLEGVLQ